MAVIILAILLIGLLLIATEPLNHINKAAVAMFAGVSCWLLYIVNGPEFVAREHPIDFLAYLSGSGLSANSVKEFIASHVFLKYIAQATNIVLFILATTCIVEVLSNNGCFDFIVEWLRTRRPKKLLWTLAIFTFILSANLDNLTTVVLMITIVHPLLQTDKLRRLYCTVIVLAANCGGIITVIGDITSLKLWTDGLVTPTTYFAVLVLPVVIAMVVMLLLLHHNLPNRIEFTTITLPFRGDDTLLNRPQRLIMLFVGIGGLWFIPTFHRITLMPPFVGALCVLALLWFVNELCNRQLLGSDQMITRRLPMALQYANLQNLLFLMGLLLMFGAVNETGLMTNLSKWTLGVTENIYILGTAMTAIASIFGNIPTLVAGVSVFGEPETSQMMRDMATDGRFWPLLSYATAMGGAMLSTSSVAGLLLMRMENVTFGWYFKHITPKVLTGFAAGMLALYGISFIA